LLFPTWEYVTRLSREIRRLPRAEVSEELRGWAQGDTSLVTDQSRLLGVSDITSGFCPTGRDVYLSYVEGVRREDNPILQRGRLIHEVFERAVETVKFTIYRAGESISGDDLEEAMRSEEPRLEEGLVRKYSLMQEDHARWLIRRLWGEAARTYAAALDAVKARSRYLRLDSIVAATVPVMAEFPIDGSLIGLSRALRVDALLPPSIIVEIKTRRWRREFDLAVAGYALAMEANYEVPVDHGVLMMVHADPERREVIVRPKIVVVGDDLRADFIDERDRRREIVEYGTDPGIARECPPECPFRHYCLGEGIE